MSAELSPLLPRAEPTESSHPLYFKSGEYRLFGWLHEGAGAPPLNLGVVICQPFGYEAVCSHRGIRDFAEAIAAAGMPALRFDYAGAGDSQDIEVEADQIKAWRDDILAAAAELKRQSGVSRICLLGFRLGAMLATLAASQTDSISGLIAVAPLSSGRRYLRDLRMTRMAASLGMDAAEEAGENTSLDMEVSGFTLSAASLASLAKVDLTAIDSSLPPMLSIETGPPGGAASPPAPPARVTSLALPGLVEMLMAPPQFAQTPKEVLRATLDWLLKLAVEPSASAAQRKSPAVRSTCAAQTLPLAVSASNADAPTERPVRFGSDGLLFGILTRPHGNEVRRRAVILLNAGADHHICASRLYVSMARRWAKHGYTVLRMDFAGVGDSGTRSGRISDDVFPKEAIEDIRDAINFLRDSYEIRDVTLAGLCSGAYHALRGAVAGLAVTRLLLVNPQNYFWKQGETLQGVQLAEVAHNPGLYRTRLFSTAAWKRIFTGQVNILRIVKIYLQRPLLVAESKLRDTARRLRIPLPNDLGSELEGIAARGVKVVFFFARGEPGIELLRLQAGNSVKRIAKNCRIHILETGDHVFTRRGARSVMERKVSEELFARPDAMGEPGAQLSAVRCKV